MQRQNPLHSARRWNLDHNAERRASTGNSFRLEGCELRVKYFVRGSDATGPTMGNITFQRAMDSRTAERAELHAKHLRPREREADTAEAEKRIALTFDRQTGNLLVSACIQGPDRHRLILGPDENVSIDPVLRSSSGRPWAASNRNSVRTRPMPSQIAE